MTYKLFVMDVDGTLTDGKIYMSSGGEIFKAFDVKDGCGIKNILKEKGIKTVIITGRNSEIVRNRAEELEIDYLYQNVGNKLMCLEHLAKEIPCSLEEVVYIGDDINDLACLEKVGFSCCPADAHDDVKNVVKYVAKLKGGQGAVRECIDFIFCGGKQDEQRTRSE